MGRVSDLLGRRIYLDANIVVYGIEGYAMYAALLRALLTAMDTGEILAVTSELTLAEVLVKPKRDANDPLQRAYRAFLQPTPALHIIPITRAVLEDAATIRASDAVKLPDAIHLATAAQQGCDAFLTNDRALGSVPFANVRLISGLVADWNDPTPPQSG